MDLIKDNFYVILDEFYKYDIVIKADCFEKAIDIYIKHIQLNINDHKELIKRIDKANKKPITSKKLLKFLPYWSKGSYIINSSSIEIDKIYEVVEEFSNIKIEDITITKNTLIL